MSKKLKLSGKMITVPIEPAESRPLWTKQEIARSILAGMGSESFRIWYETTFEDYISGDMEHQLVAKGWSHDKARQLATEQVLGGIERLLLNGL